MATHHGSGWKPTDPPPGGRPHGSCPTCLSTIPLVDFAIDGPGRCPDPWHDEHRPATALALDRTRRCHWCGTTDLATSTPPATWVGPVICSNCDHKGCIAGVGIDMVIIDDPIREPGPVDAMRTAYEQAGLTPLRTSRWHDDDLVGTVLRADRANPDSGVPTVHGAGITANVTPRRLPPHPAPFHGLSIRAVRAIPVMLAAWARRTRDGWHRR